MLIAVDFYVFNLILQFSLNKEEIKALKRLGGEVVPTNNLPEFRNLIKNCNKVVKHPKGGNIVVRHIFHDLSNRFGDKLDDDMLLCSELAKWHFEKGRYINAAITLLEGIIKKCADLLEIKITCWDDSQNVRGRIHGAYSKNEAVSNFIKNYKGIRDIRNDMAHAKPLETGVLTKLENYIDALYTFYNEEFKGKPQNEEALKDALDYM